MTWSVRALVVLAALLAGASPCGADRASAGFYVQRGEKALREKDWTTAQEQFRKATVEDPDHIPAYAGLGEALIGGGDRAGGLQALRKALALADGGATYPAAWGGTVTRVRKRVTEVDTAGTALEKIVEKYVADLSAFGGRWVKKDLEAAERALGDLRKVRPADRRTKALADALAKLDEATWQPLFNGKDSEGWLYMDNDLWKIQQGTFACSTAEDAYGTRTKATFRGDYDVRVEARLIEKHHPKGFFGIMTGLRSNDEHSSLCVDAGRLLWLEHRAKDDRVARFDALADRLPKSFDGKAWTVYEIRIRGANVEFAVNGEVVTRFTRDAGRDEGAIGVKVERANAAFRRIEWRPR